MRTNFIPDVRRNRVSSKVDLAVICSPSYVCCERTIFLRSWAVKIPFAICYTCLPIFEIIKEISCRGSLNVHHQQFCMEPHLPFFPLCALFDFLHSDSRKTYSSFRKILHSPLLFGLELVFIGCCLA